MFLKRHRADSLRHKRRSIALQRQSQYGMCGARKLHLERLEIRAMLSFSDIGLDLTGTKNAWGDINNDGWTDLYDGYTVWQNDSGSFSELQTISSESAEGVLGDYDNDGYLDIFVYETYQLWHNKNGTSFEDVTSLLPVAPMSVSRAAVWGDFNGDTFLDLYVGGYEAPAYQPDALLINNQGESFSVAWTQGNDSALSGGQPRPSRGITSADWDQDGDLDVYVSNYRLEPNQLRRNGPGGTSNLAGLGWGQDSAKVRSDPGIGLSTNVAHAPTTTNTTTTKAFSGPIGNKLVLTADMYVTGIYDTAGGEGLVGIHDGTASVSNGLLVGPQGNPANPGYPGPGGGGWGVFDGLDTEARINITDGGSPGVGNQFKGIGSGTVQVQLAIDQAANTISVDIVDLVGGASLNPTWVMPLTAAAEQKLQNVNSVMMTWNDTHPGDTREIDNIQVVSPDSSVVIFSETFEGAEFGLTNDVAGSHGATADGGQAIGAAFGDIDNDGLLDIFAGNFSHAGQPESRFLRNRGPGFDYDFQDMGQSGVYRQESYASPALGDIDNDGDLDLFFTSVYAPEEARLFRNDSGPGEWLFTDVTDQWGLGGITGFNYSASFADFDNDGDLDLGTSRIFRNDLSGNNNWLKVRLEGDGTTINRSAIGSQVRASFDGLTLTRQVEGGTGEGNQNDLALHFGLGTYSGDIDLEVTWSDGTTQTVTATPNQTEVISLFEPSPDRTWTFNGLGSWNDPNWFGGPPPNANNEQAIFAGAISAPQIVVVNTPVTVQSITFDNANSYVLAGAGSVNLSSENGLSTIEVLEGHHQFQAMVNLGNTTHVEIASGASLSFNNRLNLGGHTLSKTGAGAMNINNVLNTAGGSVAVAAGALGGAGEVRGNVYNSGGTLSPGGGFSGLGVSSGNIEAIAAADPIENKPPGKVANPIELNRQADLRNLNFTLVSGARLADAQSGQGPLVESAGSSAARQQRDLLWADLDRTSQLLAIRQSESPHNAGLPPDFQVAASTLEGEPHGPGEATLGWDEALETLLDETAAERLFLS